MNHNYPISFGLLDSKLVHDLKLRTIRRLSASKSIVELSSVNDSTKYVYQKLENNWKLSPQIKSSNTGNKIYSYNIQVRDLELAFDRYKTLGFNPRIIDRPLNILEVSLPIRTLDVLKRDSNISFIDMKVDSAAEETTIRSHDLFINGIQLGRVSYPNIDGSDFGISVKERSIIPTDIDLLGRNYSTYQSDPITSSHATEMATLIGGIGNSNNTGQGVAPGVIMTSSSFNSLFADPSSYFDEFDISIQNNSYGSSINNYYSLEAQSYDNLIINQPKLSVIFSAGNSGELESPNGIYQGLEGFSNLTGSYKQAKNIMLIGAIDRNGQVNATSSRGPTFDGRIKPELVAFGGDGSSDAAALVSGSIAMLQHLYHIKYDDLASASLIKASLLASAEPISQKIVSHETGYGGLNLFKNLRIIDQTQFMTGTISANSESSFTLEVPANTKNLRVVLSWLDPPANPGDYKTIINDLNLILENTSSEDKWYPWVLSTLPEITELNKNAVRGIDSLNTSELISVSNPLAGTYKIFVQSGQLSSDQSFSIAYSFDSKNEFTWYSPVDNSQFEAGEKVMIRWRNSFAEEFGDLFISYGEGIWQEVSNNIALNQNFYEIQLKDTISKARLRMQIGSNESISDYFSISPRPNWNLEYDCDDEALITWTGIEGAQGYKIENIDVTKFQTLVETSDTSYFIDKSTLISDYWRLSTIVDDQVYGIPTSAIDITSQNVGCYIRLFSGQIDENDQGVIQLLLGSDYNVEAISIKNLTTNVELNVENTRSLEYTGYDQNPEDGFQTYQASVELADGRKILSDTLFLTYFIEDQALVFPNPVSRSEGLLVITPTVDPIFELIDISGRPVFQTTISGNAEYLYFDNLRPGIFIYRITDNGRLLESQRLIIH